MLPNFNFVMKSREEGVRGRRERREGGKKEGREGQEKLAVQASFSIP